MSKKTAEFQAFDAMMGKLLSVPHTEIKAKMDAEKAAKKAAKKRKPKRTSASRESGDREGA